MTEVINGVKTVYTYAYDNDNRVTSVTVGNGTTVISSVSYTYDAFGRMSQQVTKHGDSTSGTTVLTESATFNPGNTENSTSGQIANYNGFTYTYDDNGNITSVTYGGKTTTYEYDSANQLIRENNQQLGTTQTWTYDNAGNILTRKEYDYTTGSLDGVTPTDTVNYTYGNSNWGDLLTAYDGATITYDQIGNPLNDGTRTYTWEHGRQLASMTDGTTTWNYTYNSDGLRTKRTNGTTTYNYVYNGSQLVQMTVDNNTLSFTYDAAGVPLTVTLNGTVYYYSTNLQGDIIAILNSNGETVVTYSYDAWGNQSTDSGTSTIGALNPLRYRGYVYDTETGLYYLQSRYYDPEIGRFINADSYASTGQGILSNNMFVYCQNNPCIYIDPYGHEGFVGIGFQIDVSTDHGTYGVEVVIYLDPNVVANTTKDSTDKVAIVIYSYSGVTVDICELAIAPQLYDMTSSLDLEQLNQSTEDEIIITLMAMMTDFQLSGGAFVIYGYDNFESAESYSGSFNTWTGSIAKPGSTISGSVYYSYSDTCWAVGVKVSASSQRRFFPIDIQFSRTYYSDPILIQAWR